MGVNDLWAKSKPFIPLTTHLEDTYHVADYLYENYVSQHFKDFYINKYKVTDKDVKSLLLFLASIHDIGKATPAFQAMQETLIPEELKNDCVKYTDTVRKGLSHHSTTGQYIVEFFLKNKNFYEEWADVVGSHHGYGQYKTAIQGAPRRPGFKKYEKDLLGKIPEWSQYQQLILEKYFQKLKISENSLMPQKPDYETLMITTGFIIMCDWIASDSSIFDDKYLSDKDKRYQEKLSKIKIPNAWRPNGNVTFQERFGEHFKPYESQSKIIDIIKNEDTAGLWIVETSVGTGKTEIALIGAEILASKFGFNGLNFSLPTISTTNNFFNRFIKWYETLNDNSYDNIKLMHGQSSLNEEYKAYQQVSNVNMDGIVKDNILSSFFGNAKTKPLTPFNVSTVDHLIMAGVDAKHQMLRHYALNQKVLVIDEVHAYDAYMNEYLYTLLNFCGLYEIPVILLSATLNSKARESFIKAYTNSKNIDETDSSPNLTFAGADGRVNYFDNLFSLDSLDYNVSFLKENLVDFCTLHTNNGENVLIIKNTVNRAKSIFNDLENAGCDVFLTHAKFTPMDRAGHEEYLTNNFGSKVLDKPKGKIVVSTQVVEQSMDIDFDVLITDNAPLDMVIQRMGRIFRNKKAVRPVQKPLVKVQWVSLDDDYSYLPYDKWTLSSSENILKSIQKITLPDDVSLLVNEAYNFKESNKYLESFLNKEVLKGVEASVYSLKYGDRLYDSCRKTSYYHTVRDIEPMDRIIFLQKNSRGEIVYPLWVNSKFKGLPIERVSSYNSSLINSLVMNVYKSSIENKNYSIISLFKGTIFNDVKVFFVDSVDNCLYKVVNNDNIGYSIKEGIIL